MSTRYVITHYSDEKLRAERFDSELEAWEYIGKHFNCPSCRETIANNGYWFLHGDGSKTWEPTNASQTACSAEWDVESEDSAYQYYPESDRL